MKKCIKTLNAILIILFVAVIIIQYSIGLIPFVNTARTLYHTIFPVDCVVTSEAIHVNPDMFHPSNSNQRNANVWMGTYDGKLYFYPETVSDRNYITEFYNNLCVFEEGTVRKIAKLNGLILGMSSGFIYYYPKSFVEYTSTSYSLDAGIHGYDLSTGEEFRLLYNGKPVFEYSISSTGDFYVLPDEQEGYYKVEGSIISQNPTANVDECTMSAKRYSIEDDYLDSYGLVTDAQGNQNRLDNVIPDGLKHMYFCKGGLLIHNEGFGDMLYFISENNCEVIELFSVECVFSTSCVALTDDYVFLSFSRRKFDDKTDATVPYENDTVSGTYRIHLSDSSVQKISDRIYTGMYVFDESGIYACDSYGQIDKLDFEGNTLMHLLEITT